MPHQKTAAELQEHGKLLYKRKEYAKALELFNEAITSQPNLTVSLLDNRAATHDKLGNVAAALQDAKSTIRLNEKDPTGYLRAGKLLEKAGKPETALGIYKHGIKRKPKNFEILKKLHDKLLRSTAPPTAADPFAQLPIELVEMILSHLTFRQIVYTTSVSKQWNNFISRLPNLWTNLDLSDARRRVKNDFISLCLNRSDRKIHSAHLKLLAGSEKAITALTKRCRDLHTLSLLDGGIQSADFIHQLSYAHNLTTLRLGRGAPMGLDSVTQLLRQITKLRTVEVLSVVTKHPATWSGEFPNLRSFTLVASEPNSDFQLLHLEQFLRRVPNLRRLVISEFTTQAWLLPLNLQSHCPQLSELDLSRCYLKKDLLPSPSLPPSIRSLRCNQTSGSLILSAIAGIALTPASHFLPHLEELSGTCPEAANLLLSVREMLAHVDYRLDDAWEHDQGVMEVFRKDPNQLSKLRTFSLKLDAGLYSSQLKFHLTTLLSSPRLSNLQTLCLTDSLHVDDSIAEMIASLSAELVTVDLSNTAVTGYGVRKIVEGCRKLKLLKMRQCEKCGPDAVEWARAQGIKVDFVLGRDTEAKGKKVRY